MNAINKLLIILLVAILGGCKMSSIIDYETKDYDRFRESFDFNDSSFNIYRKDDFLLFARFFPKDHTYFTIFMSVYSLDSKVFNYSINRADLIDSFGNIIFSSKDIEVDILPKKIMNNLPEGIKEGPYLTNIVLLEDFLKNKLKEGEYILNVYLDNEVYSYQIYSKKRTYALWTRP